MLVIRDLDGTLLDELQSNAARNGRSLDAEVASILACHLHLLRASGLDQLVPPPSTAPMLSDASNPVRVSSLQGPRPSMISGPRARPASSAPHDHRAGAKSVRIAPMKTGLRMLLDISGE